MWYKFITIYLEHRHEQDYEEIVEKPEYTHVEYPENGWKY